MANGTNLPPLDYTSRDQQSIFEDAKARIQFFVSEWTDQNETDPGIWLLRLFSGMVDVLHWYLDQYANNSFLPTARTRAAAIKLLKLIDYEPDPAVAATVDLQFTLASTFPDDVTIPSGTSVQTGSGAGIESIVFETTEDLVITAGNTQGTVSAKEGQSISEEIGVSDGTKYQEFTISSANVLRDSIQIFVDEGSGDELWTEAESFAGQGPDDQIYVVELTPDEEVLIRFGDNGQGSVPVSTAEITADYRVGGGDVGNVGADSVTELNDTIYHLGSPISVEVTNPTNASGGTDEESLESMKRNGPLSLRTKFGTVTEEDFTFEAQQVDGVAKAYTEELGYRTANVYIAPSGGGLPSQQLKDDVQEHLKTRAIITEEIFVLDPTYVYVDLTGTVYVHDNYVRSDVEVTTLNNISEYFSFDEQLFGQDVNLSDVYALIDNTTGVDHVDLTKVSIQPVINYSVWTGDSTFGSFVLNSDTVAETWTIEFTSATTFKVTGSVSGLQTNTGSLDSAYVVDDSSFGFTLTSGSFTHVTGDHATVRVSKLIGNVEILASEIVSEGSVTLTFSGGAG